MKDTKEPSLIYELGTVSPALLKDKRLFEAEHKRQLPLRVAFLGILACCDSQGRFLWEAETLKQKILPFDPVNVAEVLDALLECGLITKQASEGQWYGCIALANAMPPSSSAPD